jgi:hypothetical protein
MAPSWLKSPGKAGEATSFTSGGAELGDVQRQGLETVKATVGVTPVQLKRSIVRQLWASSSTPGAKVSSRL